MTALAALNDLIVQLAGIRDHQQRAAVPAEVIIRVAGYCERWRGLDSVSGGWRRNGLEFGMYGSSSSVASRAAWTGRTMRVFLKGLERQPGNIRPPSV